MTTDIVIRDESATVAFLGMADEVLIPATIAKAENAVRVTGECLAYFREAKNRFDNRGRAGREICGYFGWRDFVERGLGKSLRTIQRQILESAEPERIAERIEAGRKRREEEDTCVNRLNRPGGFGERCRDYVLRALVYEQARLLDCGDHESSLQAAALEGRVVEHICDIADNARRLGHDRHCYCEECLFTPTYQEERWEEYQRNK